MTRLKMSGKILLLLLIFTLVHGVDLSAETEIRIDGQLRVRSEVDDKSFISTTAEQYVDLRTRLGVSATIEENTTVYIQLQDSRRLGEKNQFGDLQSGTLNDSKNVDLHQGYLKVAHLWKNGPGFKAGRFELNYGNQRIFGAVGWHNVGRSWEGFLYWLDRPSFKIDYFWLKLEEDNTNRDQDIYGLYADIKKINTHLFGFLEHDNDRGLNFVDPLPKDMLKRYNVGLYYHREYKNFNFIMNGVYQFGERYYGSTMSEDIYQDIKAFLVTFEAGYTFDGKSALMLAGGFDYSSGDEDTTDSEFKVYQNSYYTGHKFRGYMDYFVRSNNEGLIDLYLKTGFKPLEGWTVKGDLHYFRSDKEYTNTAGTTNDLGVEFDLTISTTRIDGVAFDMGASVFVPSDEYGWSIDSEPRYWLYAMMTAGFNKNLK